MKKDEKNSQKSVDQQKIDEFKRIMKLLTTNSSYGKFPNFPKDSQ